MLSNGLNIKTIVIIPMDHGLGITEATPPMDPGHSLFLNGLGQAEDKIPTATNLITEAITPIILGLMQLNGHNIIIPITQMDHGLGIIEITPSILHKLHPLKIILRKWNTSKDFYKIFLDV